MILRKLGSRISYGFKTFILHKEIPYLLIFVLTDKCNLNCFYCESKNSGEYHFSYDKAKEAIQSAYKRGHRSIGITGGEPTLWQDDGHSLTDLLEVARDIGFIDFFVATNGTYPLSISYCKYVVTIDGTREIHNRIRDNSYEKIIKNVREAKTKNIYATITLSKSNADDLETIIDSITNEDLFKGSIIQVLQRCCKSICL